VCFGVLVWVGLRSWWVGLVWVLKNGPTDNSGNQRSVFVRDREQHRDVVAASFEVAFLLAKKKKPFTDGEELIKPTLEIVARFLDDKKIEKQLLQISLSNNTITRRIEHLSENITEQIRNYAANCKFFSLALDESTDVTDTAQLCIFIRTINDRFEVYEELLAVEAMTGTTKGVNLFGTLKACVERNNIDWTI